MVDVARPMQWAPGWIGEKFGSLPAFARTVLQKGRVYDVLDPRVREHPGWFRLIERDVTPADIERLEKLQRLEREGDQAVR
jgi:hypothetical protein